jgi:hypothetical protein
MIAMLPTGMPRPIPVLVHAHVTAVAGRLAVLLALALGCRAADMEPVDVGGLVLAPAGDLRDREHRFEFHPKAMLGVAWNSSALIAPSNAGGSDSRLRGLTGILIRYHPQPGLDGVIDAEIERSTWQRHPELDTGAGLLRAGFDYRAPALAWAGETVWRRSQENLLNTGEQVTQDHQILRTRFGHQGGRWWEDAFIAISRLDYLQGTAGFDERQGDHCAGDFELRFGLHNGGDRAFIAIRTQAVRYAVGERFNDCHALTTTTGVLHPASERSTLHAEAGFEVRRYVDDYLGDPANGDQVVLAPWWDAGGTWSWQEGDQLQARFYSDVADSLTSNATWAIGAAASSHNEISQRFAVESGIEISQTRDGGLVQGDASLQRRIVAASIAGQYALAPGLAMRLQTTATRVEANAGGGYDRLEISLDLAYAF